MIVAGAGPVGVAAATLLAQHGIACTVLDRHREPYPLPRAVHLDGAAIRVLQQIGVADAFAAISRTAAGLRLLDGRLRPFAVVDRAPTGADGHPESALFDQPALERLLRANLARYPHVTLRGGVEVTGVGPGGVAVTDSGTGERQRLTAAAVLGCDGAASTVRAAIGARLREVAAPQRWFVVDVRCPRPLPTWGGIDQVCDPRRAATFLHVTGDRYRFEFRMLPGETPQDLARPECLGRLTAPWLGDSADGRSTVLRSAGYTFRAGTADRWRHGRTLLLGDAAHLTPSFVGQGLGLGLGDAHNLAWRLAAVLRGDAGDDLLDGYERERAGHARSVIRTAVRVGRAMTGGNGAVAALRRPMAAAVLRLPAVRAREAAAMAVHYGSRRGSDLIGTRCPQPWVHDGDVKRRLDDVLGPGFALLRSGPVAGDVLTRARVLGAREVRIGRPGITDDGTLERWLRSGRASAVLLRPDRIVMGTDRHAPWYSYR